MDRSAADQSASVSFGLGPKLCNILKIVFSLKDFDFEEAKSELEGLDRSRVRESKASN
jgi:hypothetical protein